jgi:hypothetical protein
MTATRRLRLARVGWLAQAGLVLVMLISGAPAYLNLLRTPCAGDGCAYFQLPTASADALARAGLEPGAYAAYLAGLTVATLVVIWALAAMLFWRNTDHWMAAYLSFGLVALSPTFFGVLTIALVQAHPAWRWPAGLLQGFGMWVLLTFGFLFPTGHFVPPWTRAIAYLTALSMTVMLLFSSLEGVIQANEPIGLGLILILLAAMLASAAAQVYRYRRVSGLVERQQAKWVVFGFVLFLFNATVFVLAGALPVFRRPGLLNALYFLMGGTLNVLMLLVLLTCVALSILRYRLWDIDVLIRRTLVYSALTALLAVAYFASVIVLESISRLFIGQGQNALVVVLSTLTLAALFVPLRRRVQVTIDRRFFRQKYDAARTLAGFASTARDTVELGVLTTRLVEVVDETMQPASIGLWLKPASKTKGPL